MEDALKLMILLERMGKVYRAFLRRLGKKYNLSLSELSTIINLGYLNRPVSLSYLASSFGMRTPSLFEVMERLELKGLIRKERASTDKRKVKISLTPKGRELLKDIISDLEEIYKVDVSKGDLDSTFNLIFSILKRLSEIRLVDIIRICYTCDNFQELDEGRYLCQVTGKVLTYSDLNIDCPYYKPIESYST